MEPLQGSGSEPASTQGGASLTLGSVIEPRWGSGGEALLKTGRLHNKRLHTEATSPSIILPHVVSTGGKCGITLERKVRR